ncbi:probable protein, unknown function [Plasmodium reichenowi]|uniref:Uncharacterized protein n=1 Tax=Plasmodium reichenowi TaxID=5854 RepID=A0A2P9D6F3_PLARE|nr:probable protein, unknown function [Plasmodium reichenowi]
MSALTISSYEFIPYSKILKLLISLITKNYFGLSYLDDDIPYIYFCIVFAFGFIIQHGFGLLEKKQIKNMEDKLEKITKDTKVNNENNNNNNINDGRDDEDDDIFYDALDTFYTSHELLGASSASLPLKNTEIKEINK